MGTKLSLLIVDPQNDFCDAAHVGDEGVKRWVLLRDTSSAVPGFEREAESFLEEMTRKGIQVTESPELLREMRRTGTG